MLPAECRLDGGAGSRVSLTEGMSNDLKEGDRFRGRKRRVEHPNRRHIHQPAPMIGQA